MTPSEPQIDAHILAASTLRTTSIGYKGLASLLKYGNLMSYAFRDYDIFVNFTRVLNHLQLQYEFVPFGLQLKPGAKLLYYQNTVKKKVNEVRPSQQYSSNRVGKDEREENKLGWADRQRLKKL